MEIRHDGVGRKWQDWERLVPRWYQGMTSGNSRELHAASPGDLSLDNLCLCCDH